MSSDRPRRNGLKNELIFGNSPSDILNKSIRDANEADERVDLEIILFGPKSRYLSDIDKLEPKRAHSTAPYLNEFDPFDPSRPDKDKSQQSSETSASAKSADTPKSSSSIGNRTNNGKKVTSRPATDSTLERMERMYKDVVAGGSSAGNNTYIDYMDYF